MIEALIPIVTGFFASLVTWLFARRKTLAEATSAEIDNYQKNAAYYQQLVDDWVKRYQFVLEDLSQASLVVKEKDRQINELMESISNLTEELKKYKQLNGKA